MFDTGIAIIWNGFRVAYESLISEIVFRELVSLQWRPSLYLDPPCCIGSWCSYTELGIHTENGVETTRFSGYIRRFQARHTRSGYSSDEVQ